MRVKVKQGQMYGQQSAPILWYVSLSKKNKSKNPESRESENCV